MLGGFVHHTGRFDFSLAGLQVCWRVGVKRIVWGIFKIAINEKRKKAIVRK
jgi:hypothetical protein